MADIYRATGSNKLFGDDLQVIISVCQLFLEYLNLTSSPSSLAIIVLQTSLADTRPCAAISHSIRRRMALIIFSVKTSETAVIPGVRMAIVLSVVDTRFFL